MFYSRGISRSMLVSGRVASALDELLTLVDVAESVQLGTNSPLHRVEEFHTTHSLQIHPDTVPKT